MKKLIAGFMTALMALLTVAAPGLAATQLGDYPSFLAGDDGTLDAYVVMGSDAQVSDVVGAVDLASRLAEVGQETVSESCPGSGTSVDGISKDTISHKRGYLDTFFPSTIRSFHYDKLETSTFTWDSTSYDYFEGIALGSNKIFTSHDFQTTGINGTQTLVVPTNVLKYQYVFKKALNLTAKAGAGTISNPEYTYPLNIQLLGQDFQIVGLGANQVKMLSGSVGTATSTTPVEYGDYSVYSDMGDSNGNWARIIVKDADGNTVATEIINNGASETISSIDLTIKVTAVRALTDGTVVGVDVVVGETNAVEKTYPSSCSTSGTGSTDYRFPGETDWCIQATQISGTANSGQVAVDDKIEVVYKPDSTQYIKRTADEPSLELPNGYGEIGFLGNGWNYDTWTTLTIKPVTGQTGYWDDGMSGASNSTVAASNLNGIEISSDVAGSIVSGANGYDKAYILFNYSLADGKDPVMVGFWDSVNSRIALDVDTATWYKALDNNVADNFDFNFTISYGNSAGLSDQQFLYVNVTGPDNSSTVNDVGSGGASYFGEFMLGPAGTGNGQQNSVLLNFVNKSTTWTATTAPEFRLFSSSSAEAKDVQAYSTDTSGNAQKVNIGRSSQDVVTDGGNIVVKPNSYSGSETVKVKVPAQALKVKMYVGETGGTAEGGEVSYTDYPSIPITSAIAKLDTEMSALKTSKHVVLVGGPCINDLVSELAEAGDFDYTCDTWPGRDFGMIKVIDDAFATGKVAMVVAGTRAEDTRVATSAVQLYDTKLDGLTVDTVEVTGTVGTPTVTEA